LENKWDLLKREVVGAQLAPYWAHGRLEVPEIKWVQTNNYKFYMFRTIHFHPSLSPRPPSDFSGGLVPRLSSCSVSHTCTHHQYSGGCVAEISADCVTISYQLGQVLLTLTVQAVTCSISNNEHTFKEVIGSAPGCIPGTWYTSPQYEDLGMRLLRTQGPKLLA